MLSFGQYLKEGGIVSMERYIRAHGKRPRSDGGPANYMFTTKRMGGPDLNDSKQVFQINATWNDAKKAVAAWAKENKLSQVYMMETTQNPENKEADASNHKKMAYDDFVKGAKLKKPRAPKGYAASAKHRKEKGIKGREGY